MRLRAHAHPSSSVRHMFLPSSSSSSNFPDRSNKLWGRGLQYRYFYVAFFFFLSFSFNSFIFCFLSSLCAGRYIPSLSDQIATCRVGGVNQTTTTTAAAPLATVLTWAVCDRPRRWATAAIHLFLVFESPFFFFLLFLQFIVGHVKSRRCLRCGSSVRDPCCARHFFFFSFFSFFLTSFNIFISLSCYLPIHWNFRTLASFD